MTSTLALALFVVLLLIALIAVPLGYPGMILATLVAFLYSILDDFRAGKSDWIVLGTVLALTILGLMIDWGTRKFDGRSRKGFDKPVTASVVGGFIGLLLTSPFSVIWIVCGLLGGIFSGGFLYYFVSTKDYRASARNALASSFSRVTALFAKSMLSLVMTIYLLIHIL